MILLYVRLHRLRLKRSHSALKQASAKTACDNFVICPAAPATAKKVVFSTQISTELKAPWSFNSGFQLTRNDNVSRCFQILLRTSKKKHIKKKTLRDQKVDFDLFYFCLSFCDCPLWWLGKVSNSRIKLDSSIFTKFSLCKIAAMQQEKN